MSGQDDAGQDEAGRAATARRIGIGLAAVGRPAYITAGRDGDLGPASERSVEVLRERTHRLLDAAWDTGVRFIDAARSYGRAEEFLGDWLARHPERRAALRIESKWGYEYVGGWAMDASVHERKEHSVAMLDRQWPLTVDALGSAPDSYLVHSITPESPALTDRPLLDRLRGLAGSGVRVGLSTSGPAQGRVIELARAIPESPFSAVQSTWNPLEQSAGDALAAAHDDGWLVVVKEALANGRLVVHPIDADGETPPDALALGAALAQPWAEVVLSGAATAEQLLANLRARPLALAALPALAVDPARYWAERSALDWT
ncbi:aldo/keto reductase [Rathayibacter tritici]|uniref:Aldo/keto reductase n=1 Tax=Rathayibacter tritici TaxID=33888 RepID=A0A161J2J5_9MICO|nr:aldo/keto reductase [Rathayibacter tritici]AND15225.1 aldo/keto reductase [Rathayibacter tritici]PPF66062.1 aldo/keto reductase [Rathayibacter tritici]PPG06631.1 aldo/keto reductase [Rathayibacter tritici]PPI47676.1 aldo/keto reductase [Rathayibacter tritici]